MISYKSIIRLAATFETGIQGKKKHWQVLYCCVFFNQYQHWQLLQPVQFEKSRGICCLQFIFDPYFGDRTSFQVSSQLHQMVIHLE